MGYTLDKSDMQTVQKLLDVIYSDTPNENVVEDALLSLWGLIGKRLVAIHLHRAKRPTIEMGETAADSGIGGKADEEYPQHRDRDKIPALKQYILTSKPDFFKHLIGISKDPDIEVNYLLLIYKGSLIAEMLRNSPPHKLAFIPYIDYLFYLTFRVDLEDSSITSRMHDLAKFPIAQLLCPDPNAEDAYRATFETLAHEINALSDYLPLNLPASAMNKELVRKQMVLSYGLQHLCDAPLEPEAIPGFVEAGGLDALLGVITRGPLSLPDAVSANNSLDQACAALSTLIGRSSSDVLAQALVERQAVAPLIQQMIHICGLEDLNCPPEIPYALPFLAKWDETLRRQISTEAQRISSLDLKDLSPGAMVVLWGLVNGAQTCNIGEITKLAESEKYVPLILAPCEPGATGYVMRAAGYALENRIGQPGDQLRKGIATPEMVEKLVILLEFDCERDTVHMSSSTRVLRELVLPTREKGVGEVVNPDEEFERVNKPFCQVFGKAIKARCEAAQALESQGDTGEGNNIVVQELSEEELANTKNVNMLKVLVDEPYTAMALLANGLLDYQQYLLSSRSAFIRHEGLQLLGALCHDFSLTEDNACILNVIELLKPTVAHMLYDPRALIRVMALKWLDGAMRCRYLKSEDPVQYKTGVDFIREFASEEKLEMMLRGTREDARAASVMIELVARHLTGPKARDRLQNNEELVGLLWSWALRDRKVNQIWAHIFQFTDML